MYEDICYRKNTVKEVICRLNFANPVSIFDTRIPKEVYKTVKMYYPIAEPQEIIGTELQINPVTGYSYCFSTFSSRAGSSLSMLNTRARRSANSMCSIRRFFSSCSSFVCSSLASRRSLYYRTAGD